MTGPIHSLRLALTCVLVICCILIVVGRLQLDELKHHWSAWLIATTQWWKRGVDRYASLPPSVLSRSAGLLAGQRDASMPKGWLLTLCLLTAVLIIFMGG